MGHFYKTLHTSGTWLQQHGVSSDSAARYVTGFYKTVLSEAVDRAENEGHGVEGFEELVNEQTPGGLNEDIIREMSQGSVYDTQARAMENAYIRLLGGKKS